MRYLKNEKGVALMMALILSLIALAIISALIYFVTQGTSISGFQKRYQTAKEAAQGDVEFVTREIIPRTIGSTNVADLISIESTLGGEYSVISLSFPSNAACLREKLLLSTVDWISCSADEKSFDLKKSDGSLIADFSVTLPGVPPQPNFSVYAKIVDTIEGNTDSGGLALEGLGVTESGSGMVTPQHFPVLYRIEVQGERMNNPDERANMSVLYAY
ncbi:MAG: hypothetical protein AB1390_01450 [Nitrospirota bacterium]